MEQPTEQDMGRDLAADLALCEAATPGPWEVAESDDTWVTAGKARHVADCEARTTTDEHRANARFIAAAREGWPAAIRMSQALADAARRYHARAEAAEAFKRWVHAWLDQAGVPHDPDPEHTAQHGCRIAGRMRWLLARAEQAEGELAASSLECDRLRNLARTLEIARDERDAYLADLREIGREMGCDHYGDGLARCVRDYVERAEKAEAELALWRPLTPQEAVAALDAAEAEPLSEERMAAILRRATDPAERLPNDEQAQLAARVKKLEAILDAPCVALFADGRDPTENERHLLNLLSWREREAAEAKQEAARLRALLSNKYGHDVCGY